MSALGGSVGLDSGWLEPVSTSTVTRRLVPPARSRGVALRTSLLTELRAAEPSIVMLCAPAGFGKSTVLGQWAEVDPRPFPWLTLTEAHNDRVRLLRDVVAVTASLRAESANKLRLLPSLDETAAAQTPESADALMGEIDGPFVLVLDDAHVLDSWSVIDELVASLPGGSTIAIASRRAVPIAAGSKGLRLPRIEFIAQDLAFDVDETAVVLGPEFSLTSARAIADRCEGWPVGVYLAGRSPGSRSGRQRSGRDAADGAGDYLRVEVLARLDQATRSFLTRTAVLSELSGSLCDAVSDGSGSAELLRGMLTDQLLVVPVHGDAERYRCHRLLRRVLLAELRAREPELIGELHARASRWFGAHGRLDLAIAHAKWSGDISLLTELVWPNVQLALAHGGVARLRGWLGDLTDDQISSSPDLIAAAAWLSVLEGRLDDAGRWQALAEAKAGRQWRSSIVDSERLGVLALLRAWRGNDGLDGVFVDSSAAFDSLAADSAWRPAAGALSGMMSAWSGRNEEAHARLVASELLARGVGNPEAQANCLAALACLEFDAGNLSQAQQLALRVLTVLVDHQLLDLPVSAFAVSVVAVGLARAGRSADAAEMLERSLVLTTTMNGFAPWMQVHNCTLQIDTAVLIGNFSAARRLIRQADGLLRQLETEHAVPPAQRAKLQRAVAILDRLPADPMFGSMPLTLAEFRILQLLPTHLSFPEIGALLFNSRHTVKTQALAVYRKLGATSRSEAVERARTLGFLPPMVIPDSLITVNGAGPTPAPNGHRYALVPSTGAARPVDRQVARLAPG